MKVSVIIPFYGNPEWLKEAINSAIEQDYGVFEILVIDDGSPYDITKLETYYDKKLKANDQQPAIRFIHQEHAGVSAARNKGIRLTQGDYIAFLDADDIWLPDKLSMQIPFMEKNGYSWSHTGFLYWNYTDNKVSSRHTDISRNHDDVSLKSFTGFRVGMMTVVIAKKVFQEHPEIRFDESLAICEDSDLFRQIAQHYPLGLIDRPLVKIRLTGHNTRLQIYKRFLAGEANYRKTKEGHWPYANIPKHSFIRCIYAYYHHSYALLHHIKSPVLREAGARILFAPIFIMERMYLRIIG